MVRKMRTFREAHGSRKRVGLGDLDEGAFGLLEIWRDRELWLDPQCGGMTVARESIPDAHNPLRAPLVRRFRGLTGEVSTGTAGCEPLSQIDLNR